MCNFTTPFDKQISTSSVNIGSKSMPTIMLFIFGTQRCFKEESRLRVFGNRILGLIFGPKRDESGEWRKLHEELHYLYRARNILRVIKSSRLRQAGHVARMEEGRSSFNILTGTPAERPIVMPRRRWEENIRIDLKEMGINSWIWIDSAQDTDYWKAIVDAALNLRVP